MQEAKKQVCHFIHCSNCGDSEMMFIRYKCAVCQDFNLCEVCESSNCHRQHLMLSIRSKDVFEALWK